MKTMRNYRKVKAPIMKTQIILKNTNYRNCYLLWQYLDQYNSLGFELIRDVKQKRFNETYRKHLSQNALFAFSTMMFHDVVREKDQKLLTKSFKVKKAQEIKLTADELKIDPESYKIEDTLMNEFYLNKTKQMFKKNNRSIYANRT